MSTKDMIQDRSLVSHLELYLGKIARGWKSAAFSTEMQIALFENQPAPGIYAYSTLGLSDHILMLNDKQQLRVELIVAADHAIEAESIVSLLYRVAYSICEQHIAPVRGEVFSIDSLYNMRGAYCSIPIFFPQEFHTYHDDIPIVFILLIPITGQEMNFISEYGWGKFEDVLEGNDLDLFNLKRNSII